MKSHQNECDRCKILMQQVEELQEELAERKKASTCPDCAWLRKELERAQEILAMLKRLA